MCYNIVNINLMTIQPYTTILFHTVHNISYNILVEMSQHVYYRDTPKSLEFFNEVINTRAQYPFTGGSLAHKCLQVINNGLKIRINNFFVYNV